MGSSGKEIREQEDAFRSLSNACNSAVNDRWLRQFQVADLDDWLNGTGAEPFSETGQVAVRGIDAAPVGDQQSRRFRAYCFLQRQLIPR